MKIPKSRRREPVGIEEVLTSMEKNFVEYVKPFWDEIEKYTYRRGNVTIIDFSEPAPR